MNAIQRNRLQQTAIFAGINDESLGLILKHSKLVRRSTEDYFFREGDQAESLFQLEAGHVAVRRQWKGQSVTLGTLGEGDCFGEMALIDCRSRSASIVATTPCEALEIPAKSLRSLLAKDLEQYAMIMMNLGREVSRRLRLADDQLLEAIQDQ